MAAGLRIRDLRKELRGLARPILTELRIEAYRVRKSIRAVAPVSSIGGPDGNGGRLPPGQLRRKLKVRTGIDANGPWARVTTTARNPKTRYRYGLAIQQRKHYLQRGLDSTPRR